MKLDSLVIAHQPRRGEYVPGPCTHRPVKPWEPGVPEVRNRKERPRVKTGDWGLSRNKVAVPEGAAGTPPFWSDSFYLVRFFIVLLFFVYSIYENKRLERSRAER